MTLFDLSYLEGLLVYLPRDRQEQLGVDRGDRDNGTGVSKDQLSQRNHSPGTRSSPPSSCLALLGSQGKPDTPEMSAVISPWGQPAAEKP